MLPGPFQSCHVLVKQRPRRHLPKTAFDQTVAIYLYQSDPQKDSFLYRQDLVKSLY